jgi:isoquinoline 1-oxidoreductase beta subunit
MQCAAETPYEVPATLVDYVRNEPDGMNTGWWRGVGPTHNVFVVESFIDELAAAARQDPVVFRRTMLTKNPRAMAFSIWLPKNPAGAPGCHPASVAASACNFAFSSYLSCVIEAAVSPQGEIILRRAVVAVDCGATVNPDTVRAQIEGGLILGLGTAMYNEITLTDGAVDQSNFHDYRDMRINEAPKIQVFPIASNEAPGGIDETGTAAEAPALGNAIFAATGQQLRRLPFANGIRAS